MVKEIANNFIIDLVKAMNFSVVKYIFWAIEFSLNLIDKIGVYLK